MAVGRVIGWIFLFAIGWIFCLAGLWVLVRDYKVLVDTGDWSPITLYGLWWELNQSSVDLVWAVAQLYIPRLWNPVIFPVLSWCWASAVLMLLGLVILRSSARGLTLTLSARRGPVADLSSRRGPASGPAASRARSGPNSLRPTAPGGATSGQRSTVDTPYIRMHLDHETPVGWQSAPRRGRRRPHRGTRSGRSVSRAARMRGRGRREGGAVDREVSRWRFAWLAR